MVAVAAFVMSCAPEGSGRFTVEALHEHSDCLGRMFPFDPPFLAARERPESMGIFAQSRGGSFHFLDVIYFEVFDWATLPLGTPIPIDPIVTYDTRVAGGVEAGASCPELTDALAIEGTITFHAISNQIDGLIQGEVEGNVRSLRSGAIVGENLEGHFDFTFQVGQPYEEFRN